CAKQEGGGEPAQEQIRTINMLIVVGRTQRQRLKRGKHRNRKACIEDRNHTAPPQPGIEISRRLFIVSHSELLRQNCTEATPK
ncbi:MAG TPA: hypothetical protein DIW43_08080, partial [Spongiibacteraceae bacterium]|nr:hypothetical protein [Spongiibacteraceae bacterium]